MDVAAQVRWENQGGVAARVLPRASSFPLTAPTAALVLLNLLDGVFTTAFLEMGRAEELNPLMRWAYDVGPLVFMSLKLLCVHAGVLVLAFHQKLSAAQWVLRGAAGVYTVLVLYHLGFFAYLVWP